MRALNSARQVQQQAGHPLACKAGGKLCDDEISFFERCLPLLHQALVQIGVGLRQLVDLVSRQTADARAAHAAGTVLIGLARQQFDTENATSWQ